MLGKVASSTAFKTLIAIWAPLDGKKYFAGFCSGLLSAERALWLIVRASAMAFMIPVTWSGLHPLGSAKRRPRSSSRVRRGEEAARVTRREKKKLLLGVMVSRKYSDYNGD